MNEYNATFETTIRTDDSSEYCAEDCPHRKEYHGAEAEYKGFRDGRQLCNLLIGDQKLYVSVGGWVRTLLCLSLTGEAHRRFGEIGKSIAWEEALEKERRQ